MHAGITRVADAPPGPDRINKTGREEDGPSDDLIYSPYRGHRGDHFRDADISGSGVSKQRGEDASGGREVVSRAKRLPTVEVDSALARRGG